MGPWERIKIYKKLVEDIRASCIGYDTIIDRLVQEAEDKISAPPTYNCNYCCDTGYEDVQGYNRCRNNCPQR